MDVNGLSTPAEASGSLQPGAFIKNLVADVDVILQPLDGTCPSIPSTIIEPPEGGAFVRIVGSIDLLVPLNFE